MKKRQNALAVGITALLIAGASLRALALPTVPPEASTIGPNLVTNAGFEKTNATGGPATDCVIGGCVPVNWKPFWCGIPYTQAYCPAQRRDTQSPARPGFNDPSLLLGQWEWKPTDVPNRVHSGRFASQFFEFQRAGDGGDLQTIFTQPVQTCVFEAYVQTWSSNSDVGSTGPFTSDTRTQDDRDNSVYYLGVAPGRDTHAYASTVTWSRAFTYADGHYDQYIRIAMEFMPTSSETTIYIRNTRIWPSVHNDSYVDDVYVGCRDAGATSLPTATRTRTPTPVPTAAQATPTPLLVCATAPACVPQVIIVTATPGAAPTATKTATPVPTVTPTIVPTATRTPTSDNPTPTPEEQGTAGPTSTGVFEVTPIGGGTPCPSYPCWEKTDQNYRVLGGGLSIRNEPRIAPGNWVGSRDAGDIVPVLCLYVYDAARSQVWASEKACNQQGNTWSAVNIGSTIYMVVAPASLLSQPPTPPPAQPVCGWAGNIRAFTRVGDSITASPAYLFPFSNRNVVQIEPALNHLWLDLGWYRQDSFERTSLAAVNGITSQGLIDPTRCNGKTLVQCELEQYPARTVLVMVGTNDDPVWTETRFSQTNIETIVRTLLESGHVPILFGLPRNQNKDVTPLNAFIKQLAAVHNLTFIDSSGVNLDADGVHPSVAPVGLEAVLHPDLYAYGQTLRNKLTLEALDALRVQCLWY